jgi:hypothetical protein
MMKRTRTREQAREVKRAALPALRALGLYLAVFGAAMIFATAIAAQPKDLSTDTRSRPGATAPSEAPRHTPITGQSRRLAGEPLTLLDVRRLPHNPRETPKVKTPA